MGLKTRPSPASPPLSRAGAGAGAKRARSGGDAQASRTPGSPARSTESFLPTANPRRSERLGEPGADAAARSQDATPRQQALFDKAEATGGFQPLNRPQVFDARVEFPNFLLTDGLRPIPASQASAEQVQAARKQLESALGSIFSRLTLPVEIDGKLQMVRYFELLHRELPDVQVLASGGVVRSTIGFVYDQIHAGMSQEPPIPPSETLRALACDESDLSGLAVRGIGSDWDVLVRCPPERFAEAKKKIESITNSAVQASTETGRVDGDLQKNIFVIGDVKRYEDQLAAVEEQGGSTLDWLAFQLDFEGSGALLDPPGGHPVVDDLVRGQWTYLPPTSPDALRDADDTALRGIRPLLELPFLALKDERAFREALGEVKRRLESGQRPSPRALGQFGKAVRNARYAGAHNRIYRTEPGSIESLVRDVSRLCEEKTGEGHLPQFVDLFPIQARGTDHRELHGLPERLLVDVDTFVRDYTSDGKLFHGTPDDSSALSILRGGLFVSGDGQGTAIYGRGAYTTADPALAAGFAKGEGLVFQLEVRRDRRLNVLDWAKAEDDPTVRRLLDAHPDEDPFTVLAREHGIDIILNHHVLVENADALRFPRTIADLVEPYARRVEDASAPFDRRCLALATYASLFRYAKALGEALPPPRQFAPLVEEALSRIPEPQENWSDLLGAIHNIALKQDLARDEDGLDMAALVARAAAKVLARAAEEEPQASIADLRRLRALAALAQTDGLAPIAEPTALFDGLVQRFARGELDERTWDSLRLMLLNAGSGDRLGEVTVPLDYPTWRPSARGLDRAVGELAAACADSAAKVPERVLALRRLNALLATVGVTPSRAATLEKVGRSLLEVVLDPEQPVEARHEVARALGNWNIGQLSPALHGSVNAVLQRLLVDADAPPKLRSMAAYDLGRPSEATLPWAPDLMERAAALCERRFAEAADFAQAQSELEILLALDYTAASRDQRAATESRLVRASFALAALPGPLAERARALTRALTAAASSGESPPPGKLAKLVEELLPQCTGGEYLRLLVGVAGLTATRSDGAAWRALEERCVREIPAALRALAPAEEIVGEEVQGGVSRLATLYFEQADATGSLDAILGAPLDAGSYKGWRTWSRTLAALRATVEKTPALREGMRAELESPSVARRAIAALMLAGCGEEGERIDAALAPIGSPSEPDDPGLRSLRTVASGFLEDPSLAQALRRAQVWG